MIHTTRKIRLTVIFISAWTITQTLFHIFWVIYAYLLSMCWIRPTYYDVVFVYLTYFYKKSCGTIHMKKETLFLNKTMAEEENYPNETASNVLYHFLTDTLAKALLPLESSVVGRTEMYLGLMFITDLVWIVTAVCLFVGVFCKLKQKFLSIIFHGPWLLCTAFVIFLDVVSSVHYGIDLIYIRNFTSWLEFIGVANFSDFQSFNELPSSSMIPALPTTVVVALLSRIFVVWLINVICFFAILFLAIPDLFPGTVAGPVTRQSDRTSGGDLNSTEARIRNWQLFYGAIEANSTMASDTSAGTSGVDHNSNSKLRRVTIYKQNRAHDNEKSSLNEKTSSPDTNNVNIPILKSHVPWSYINPEGEYVRKHHSANPAKPDRNILHLHAENQLTYCTRL